MRIIKFFGNTVSWFVLFVAIILYIPPTILWMLSQLLEGKLVNILSVYNEIKNSYEKKR